LRGACWLRNPAGAHICGQACVVDGSALMTHESNRSTPRPARSFGKVLHDLQKHVPMYADLWRDIDFNSGDYSQPEQFSQVPILRKSDLLARTPQQRLDQRFAGQRLSQDRTSGSTGQPLELLIDKATKRRRSIRFLRALVTSGYRPGNRFMLISSRSSGSIKTISPWARLARWHYVDLYLGAEVVHREYERIRPTMVYGPLSSLTALAESLRSSSRVSPLPVLAISTAEQLTTTARRLLESVFTKTVTDFYGATELGLVAWRNAACGAYSTFDNDFLLEYLPSTDMPGFERLIVTDLHAGSMPLVRYDTGDLVCRRQIGDESRIHELVGREVDCLWLKDGQRVSPYAIDGVLSEAKGVQQYCVIQQRSFDVEVTVAASMVFHPQLQADLSARLAALCPDLKITVTTVSEPILVTTNKARSVRSLVRNLL
jgi:phenylacetate-CoA ligase